ncbi:MAG: vitamin B12-dependent ribonucleotide reductase [Candidatus Omnitrophica bacterium]|nr:vitamin B12-dependent ribonucleotide reductase [Candidatus Omnitrophota bacterium]
MQVKVSPAKKLHISENCLKVLERRYLKKDKNGKLIETPEELFIRVSSYIAEADRLYGATDAEVAETQNNFYKMMADFEFMPNSPTLMNAGKDLGQLSACFAPDQIVITKSGPKRISEIKNGEWVLTHKNRFKEVTKTFVRKSNEIYILNAYKLPTETLKVTGEHPILAVKKGNNGSPVWIQIKDLSVGDYVAMSFPKEIVDVKDIKIENFINDRELIDIDGVLYGKNTDIKRRVRRDGSIYVKNRNRSGKISQQVNPIKNRIEIDVDLMRLFGYYLSEGCISDNSALRFTFSEKEKGYCEDVLKIVKEKFGINSHIEETDFLDRRWLSIRFHSKIVAGFFENLFGTGYASKKIPLWITLLPIEKQKGLLAGMFRGDSCTFKNGNNFSTKLVMCNMNLIYAAWQLVMRAGHFAALNFESMPKLGRVLPVRCTVSGESGTKLMNELLDIDIAHNGKSYIRTIVCGDTLLTPITEIIKQPYQGEVYNLEVEEDHSYCANMVGVHNCFVLPIEDSMESIFEAVKNTALIHRSGGGTGFSFSRLRPKNSMVRSTGGVSSGPVSFMKVFNAATQAVKQGGARRGANMGILRVDHPDILEFIKCKENDKEITNFNISIAITEDFMNKVINDEEYDLIDPHTKKAVNTLKAKEVFDLIVEMAWKNGEPGIIFIDRMNQFNPTPNLGQYESTNPCGEQILLPFESCNLGSINLSNCIYEKNEKKEIDWEKLKRLVYLGVHFLDNVIDMNKFPLKQIEEMTKKNRKIGLGVMGLADMFIQLGIPYNSDEAVELAEKIMSFIDKEAKNKSKELAQAKGAFPSFDDSIFAEKGLENIRNATLTTIAPTGTISIISNTSSGIEPLFALSYYRNVMDNDKLIEVNSLFEAIAKKEGFYSRKLMEEIAEKGSVKDVEGVPEKYKKIFVTSHDIAPLWHIRMQAVFQKYTDNAVSKTVNFPHDATRDDIREVYMLAYKQGCKGVTIYRDKSRDEQVLNISAKTENTKDQVAAVKDNLVAPRPRPVVTTGTTTKVTTGCGNLYVTINVDDHSMPFEVFIQMGKAGGCAASQLEAVGRLVSLALRSGVENKKIIDQLRGIRCPSPSWQKGGRIFSCADAIARVLELRLGNGKMHHEEEELEHRSPHTMIEDKLGNVVGVCPDCGAALRHEEGCVVCRSCGYSKC